MENIHFVNKTNEWSTPQDLFNRLNWIFNFTLDPCATKDNAKCKKYYTKEQNGLNKDWSNEKVFMNPPYGREIGKWIEKAYKESCKGALVICLIPARTDTKYWHNYIFGKAIVKYLKGRLKFGKMQNSAPFPSAIVIFGI